MYCIIFLGIGTLRDGKGKLKFCDISFLKKNNIKVINDVNIGI